ncbi:RidA family protein [soil metagenome]
MDNRIRVSTGSKFEDEIGYSRAVRSGDLIFVTGTAAMDENGKGLFPNDASAQTKFILGRIEKAIIDCGGKMSHVIRVRVYVTDFNNFPEIAKALGEVFRPIKPAITAVGVSSLIDKNMLVEIEADALVDH